jgi:flagellum-specific peptidoglycan hydrolase FlgJ
LCHNLKQKAKQHIINNLKKTNAMISNSDIIRKEQIISINGGYFHINFYLIQLIVKEFILKHWLNMLLALMLTMLILKKDIRLTVSSGIESDKTEGKALAIKQVSKTKKTKQKVALASMADVVTEQDDNGDGIIELLPKRAMIAVLPTKQKNENAANEFNIVSVFEKSKKNAPSTMDAKQAKCWDYVTRFVSVARAEKTKFGIPISITLAQGLLESDAGESSLTRKANNHFGVKTFDKKVSHVVMKDDTPRDKFKKYNSAWESYRDHSQLLMRDHYKHLQFLSKTDYVGWAKGLEKAGYATDPFYAEKLVKIIESLQLYRFDEA